jgi:hypothetical protein
MKTQYREQQTDDIVQDLINMMEESTGKTIFTVKVLNDTDDGGFETLVVFNDKTVMHGIISIEDVNGRMATRIRANYI